MSSLSKADLQALRQWVRERYGRVSSEELDEICQEALVGALGAMSDKSPSSRQLLEKAKQCIRAVRRDRANALRRGHRVATDAPLPDSDIRASKLEKPGTLEQHRRARPPRVPHKPKGVARIEYPEYFDRRFDHARESIADIPAEDVRTMAARLQKDWIVPVLHGDPLSPKAIRLVRKVYERLFGNSLEFRWAEIVVEELEVAARNRLSHETQRASHATVVPEWSGSPRAILTVEETLPGTSDPHVRQIVGDIRPIRRVGDRTLAEIVAEFDGKERVFARCWLSPFDQPGEYDPDTAASVVLRRANERTGDGLPDWMLDIDLVKWLITRINFDGGASDKLKSERVLELLKDPLALADDIDRYAIRRAERCTDHDAARLEPGLREIAKRVRLVAGSRNAEGDAGA